METISLKTAEDWDKIGKIIEVCVGVIERGGCLIYPTDTVYGLGVDALRQDSVARLFKIKKRPETKPVPIIVRDIEMAKKIAFVDKRIEKVLAAVWPGSVTVVLEKKGVVPVILTAGKNTVGLRIPKSRFTRLLMEQLGRPLTATSANFSGQPPLTYSMEIEKTFGEVYPRPDLFLDAGDLPNRSPSTVLDLTGSQPKILRAGPVSKEQLMEMFKK
jgi:L-threonylcarbamoyladenylate synthase